MLEREYEREWVQQAKEIDHIILDGKDIMVIGHLNPDGDCVGSMLAMYHYYGGKGKNLTPVLMDPVPLYLTGLPGADKIVSLEAYTEHPDVIILLDCNSLGRAGDDKLCALSEHAQVVNIDHHAMVNPKERLEEGIRLADPEASATGELLYEYFQMIDGWEPLPADLKQRVAQVLFTSIAADTGMFRFNNTSSKTFRYAGDLLDCGVDIETARILLFEKKSREQLTMQGMALDKLEVAADGKIAYIAVTQADMARAGVTENNSGNLVGNTMLLDGVKIGMIFQELSDGVVKISLRSRNGYNVGKIAASLGGGGHVLAAGCRMIAPMEQVIKEFLTACEKEIALVEQA